MKRRKKSIGRKVTELLLGTLTAAMFLTGAVSIGSLYSMRSISAKSNTRLGQTAAEDAESALEEMAGSHLQDIAMEKAAYIQVKFDTVVSYLHGIAAVAEEIYAAPESYPGRAVALPQAGSTSLAPQLLRSGRLAQPTEEQREEALKLGNLQDLLVQYNANDTMVSSTYVATVSGWMIQADYIAYSKYTEDASAPEYYEADTRQWYQRALQAQPGQVVYSDVIADIHEGGDCIVCAQPVYLDGEIVAVAGVGSYLDTVRAAVLDTTIGENGYAFLLNEKGQVMVSGAEQGETAAGADQNGDLRESVNANLADAAADMVSGGSGRRKLSVDGKEVYLAYAPLEGLGWSFVTVMDVEEVIAPARESQQGILALTQTVLQQQDASIRRTMVIFPVVVLLAALGISGAGILFTRKLTDPIRRLTAEVAQIDGGNLDYRIRIHTGDEMEDLGRAFNGMAGQLQRYIQNLAAVTAERERIRTEIQVAARLQADMLPETEGAFGDRKEFSLAASMRPAKGVGGDFYDFFLMDRDHLALVMADVSGKGVPAALFMVVSRTLIRSHLTAKKPLEQNVAEINESLCANNKNGMFVTAWIGVLTLSTGELTFVNAGHCSPLVKHRDGACDCETAVGGLVLAAMEGIVYRRSVVRLRPGDTLLLYTDGVTEAADTEKELYGEKRLKAAAEAAAGIMPQGLLDTVQREVDNFQKEAEQFDDITLLAVTYHGSGFAEKTGKPDIRDIREFSVFAEEYFKEQKITGKTIAKLLLAVDEIFSNICYYSGAKEVTLGVGVTADLEPRTAILYFEDDGIPYDPLEKPDPDVGRRLEERRPGGLGIYLVKKRMDRVKYEYLDNRNRLTLEKAEE